MGRTKRSAKLDTWNARKKLQLGKTNQDPIAPGQYLGYRRPASGAAGSWFARWRQDGKILQERLGTADDFQDADGIDVLSWDQAQDKAKAWFQDQRDKAIRSAGGEPAKVGPYTVADAWRAYHADAVTRGVHGARIMQQVAEAHILPELGALEVGKLTLAQVRKWHRALAALPRRRTGRARREGEDVQHQAAPATEDALRARKDTANRILTNLKAALNFAARELGIGRGVNWREVQPFQNVGRSRVRFLTVVEQRRLVNVCPPDFQALVMGGLFTGARYGELTKVLVRDFDPENGSLFIQFGKAKHGYKARHVVLTTEAQRWFKGHVAGRPGDEPMFVRGEVRRRARAEALAGWIGWAPYDEDSFMAAACEAAKIGKMTFYELRHTFASGLVNRGVPLAFVAEQLGHSDIRMVQRHYGHLAPSAKAEAIRKLAPRLGISSTRKLKVEPLKIAGGKE